MTSGDPEGGLVRAVDRLLGLVLRLGPRRFRDVYGPEMRSVLRQLIADRRQSAGPLRASVTAVAELANVALAALRQRFRAPRYDRPDAPRTPGHGDLHRLDRGSETMMATLWYDLQNAVRSVIRRPAWPAVAALTLAIGIGANTAVFSVVHSVLLRSLPYPESDRLVALYETDPRRSFGPGDRASIAYQNFRDWRESARSFEGMAAYAGSGMSLTGGDLPERVVGTAVTVGYFSSVLGVRAALGRTFVEGEDRSGADPVVVLSHDLWRRQFGGDSDALGRMLTMDGTPYTVVGVMPGDYEPLFSGTEYWIPLQVPESRTREDHFLLAIGRLRPDVSLEDARSEMDAIAGRLAALYPETNAGDGALVTPLQGDLNDRNTKLALWTLLGAVGFVLLIACANLANLMLARASRRSKEVAIRASLGADRSRLVRQFLGESLVVALVGGTVGLAIAFGGLDLIVGVVDSAIDGTVQGLRSAHVSGAALAFTAGVCAIVWLLVGLAPALQGSRLDVVSALKAGGGRGDSGGDNRTRSGLVVAEVALSLVLLSGAGLMLDTLVRLQAIDPGFEPEGRLSVRINPPEADYPGAAEIRDFYDRVLRRLGSLPGVESAALVNTVPTGGSRWRSDSWTIDERGPWPEGEEPSAGWLTVTPRYLETMGIPLLAGRFFDARDREDAPLVMVINETFARRYWPDESPIGKRVTLWGETREIVGVIGDTRHRGPLVELIPEIFLPFHQATPRALDLVLATAHDDPTTLLPSVREAIWSVDDDLPVYAAGALDASLADSYATPRVISWLLAVFAGVALALAALGIYGVIAYSVARRTREIGVRIALGAGRRSVVRMVLLSGLRLTGLGLAVGLVAALALSRTLTGLLYGTSTLDPLPYAIVCSVLLAVAGLASYVPARRASAVSPLEALRYE